MTGAVDTTRAVILRPARRFRIVMACLSAVLVVMSVAALPYNAWLGAIGIAVFAPCLVIFFVPLVHRTSWAAEIDAEGFRVRDFFGRVRHRVRWEQVEQLFPITENSWRGPGTELRVAWRCSPRRRLGGFRPRWLAGMREADAHFPDTYGYDPNDLIELSWPAVPPSLARLTAPASTRRSRNERSIQSRADAPAYPYLFRRAASRWRVAVDGR